MEKYKTCKYALDSGVTMVRVTAGCKRANMIKGTLVSTKRRCQECRSWKKK